MHHDFGLELAHDLMNALLHADVTAHDLQVLVIQQILHPFLEKVLVVADEGRDVIQVGIVAHDLVIALQEFAAQV